MQSLNKKGICSGYGRAGLWMRKCTMAFLILILLGCGGGSPPPTVPAAKPVPGKPAGKQASLLPAESAQKVKTETPAAPVPPQPVAFTYSAEGRRDPFRSILVIEQTGGALESLPPLQRAQIEELKLIAIVWGGFGYSAMLETPDGKGYTVRVGTLVGPNSGVIRRITERVLMIDEKYTDIFGERKTREVKLDLHPQKEGSE